MGRPAVVQVDDNGNPIAAVQVDDSGQPIATPADIPLPEASSKPSTGTMTPKPEDGTAGEYAMAVIKGAAKGVGVPTSISEWKQAFKDAALKTLAFPYKQGYDAAVAAEQGVEHLQNARKQPTTARAVQEGVKALPILGEPLAAVAGPGISYSEGRAPTHQENIAAVESGAAMTAMASAPKVAEKILPRRRVIAAAAEPPITPEVSPVTPEEQALVDQAGAAQAEAATKPPTPRTALEQTHRDAQALLAERNPVRVDDEGQIIPEDIPDNVRQFPSQAEKPATTLRDQLFAHDEAVKQAEAAHLQAVKDTEAKLSKVEVTPFGKRPRNAVTVDGEGIEFATQKEADAIREAGTAQTRQRLADAKAARDAFHQSLSTTPEAPKSFDPATLSALDAEREAATRAPSASIPGESPTVHEDNSMAIPSVSDVGTVAKRFAPIKEMLDGIAPASASEGAASAADILRKSKAEIANDAAIERHRNAGVAKQFARTSDTENIGNISEYERTGKFQNVPDGYSEMYRETTDAAHKTLQEVYGDDRVGYVDNYVRRAFKFGTEADAAKASGVLSNYIGSLSANQSPLKGRVLNVPLDEALRTMRDNGIDVKPATTNPELLRQWTVENANQARVYKQAWDDAKAGELIKFVGQSERVPSGMVALDDKVAKVFRPTDEGMVQTGRYFAEPGVARIFNNAISKGLGGSPTFRAIRSINNAYNQMQLGMSAFHLTGTAINAGISDLSLGLQQILQGDFGKGTASIGRSAVPALSFTRDMFKGRNFINDLVADDPAARQVLEEKLNPAGGRLGIDAAYRNTAYDNMVTAWSNRRIVRAAGNLPLAIVQKMASPLMEYAIPRVKIGAFLDLADAMRSKLGPDATPVEIQRSYEQAWDSIDNRFGQLTHDNLFWNRTAADLAQVSTRSVGWNLGTARELGGGIVDASKGQLSPRVLYSAALPIYAGTIGAIYMYLHTGKRPETLKDYYYPQNGLKDNRGRDDRASLPIYMKDVFAYSSHPVATVEHKASPLLSMAFALGTNQDYFGDMIRNPDETASKQWQQMGSYALLQFRPLAVQQAVNTAGERNSTTAQIVEPFFGFTKASSEMKMSDEQLAAAKSARRARNEAKMNKAAARHGK